MNASRRSRSSLVFSENSKITTPPLIRAGEPILAHRPGPRNRPGPATPVELVVVMERKAPQKNSVSQGKEVGVDLGLEGKVALVTAASKGLGRAVATEIAREGARIVISSRDDVFKQKTAYEIREERDAEVDYRTADLRSAEDIRALVSHTAERFGGV